MPVLGYKAFFWAEVCMAPSRNSVSKEDIFSRKMKMTVLKGKVLCSEAGPMKEDIKDLGKLLIFKNAQKRH